MLAGLVHEDVDDGRQRRSPRRRARAAHGPGARPRPGPRRRATPRKTARKAAWRHEQAAHEPAHHAHRRPPPTEAAPGRRRRGSTRVGAAGRRPPPHGHRRRSATCRCSRRRAVAGPGPPSTRGRNTSTSTARRPAPTRAAPCPRLVCGVHCSVTDTVRVPGGWTSQPLANPSISVGGPEVLPAAVDGGLPSLVDALAQHQPERLRSHPVTLQAASWWRWRTSPVHGRGRPRHRGPPGGAVPGGGRHRRRPPGAESSASWSMSRPVAAPGGARTTWLPGAQGDPVRVGPARRDGQAVAGQGRRGGPVTRDRHGPAVDGEEVGAARARASPRARRRSACRGCRARRCRWGARSGPGRSSPWSSSSRTPVKVMVRSRPVTAGKCTGTLTVAPGAGGRPPAAASRWSTASRPGHRPSAPTWSQRLHAQRWWAPSGARPPRPRGRDGRPCELCGRFTWIQAPSWLPAPSPGDHMRRRVPVERGRGRGVQVTGKPARRVRHHPALVRHRVVPPARPRCRRGPSS